MSQPETMEAESKNNVKVGNGTREGKKFRVLSISGGGTRGIIPSLILLRLEQITGHHVTDMFDLLIGTSTGAMICGVLTIPQKQQNKIEKTKTPEPSTEEQHSKGNATVEAAVEEKDTPVTDENIEVKQPPEPPEAQETEI